MKNALDLLKAFCEAYFDRRDIPGATALLADDARVFGVCETADMRSPERIQAFLEGEAPEEKGEIRFMEESCHTLGGGASEGFLRVEAKAAGIVRRYRLTGTRGANPEGDRLKTLHIYRGQPEAHTSEVRPETNREREDAIREELMGEAFAGGIVMCYREEGYPVYYVNRNLLKSLGYESEEQYLRDNDGLSMRSVYPEDRGSVREQIDKQLREKGVCSLDYRKRRRDGSYIWVRQYGRAFETAEGRPALSCVIFDISAQKNTQAQLDNLINAIPGGVARYLYENGQCELVYQTDGVGALTGRTIEEYRERIKDGLQTVVYQEDMPAVIRALDKACETDETVSVSYRAPHKAGGYVWLTACLRRAGTEGGKAVIHAAFIPLSRQSALYQALVDATDSGIVVRDFRTHELLFTNKTACDMLRVPYGNYTGKKCYEFFYGSESPCPYCQVEDYKKGSMLASSMFVPHLNQYFTMKGTIINWAGREAVIEYLDDVTELTVSHTRIDDLVQNVPCGICLYSWDGEELRPVLVNAQFSEMLGEDAYAYLSGVTQMRFLHVHPEDLDALQRAARVGLRETHRIDHTYRSRNKKTGEYLWVRLRGSSIQQPDGTWLIYLSYFDVTQEHKIAQKLRESERALEYAAEMSGLWYWTYDPKLDRAYLDARNQRDFHLPPVMDDFLETWLGMGILHPDYVALFRDAFRRVREGEKDVTIEVRYYRQDRSLHWARFLLVNVKEEKNSPHVVICTALPIDAEKELQAKYELEKKKPSLGEGTLLVHALFNLTTGTTLEYAYQDGNTVPLEGRTAFTGDTDYLDKLLIDPEERERYRAINEKAYLMQCYEKGETELSIDYRRLIPSGRIVWVRNILHLVRDPSSNDILLFEYCYDVEDEKIREIMYHSLATDNYDFVAKIDGKTRRYTVIHRSGSTGAVPPSSGADADENSLRLLETAHPDDRETLKRNTLVAGIRERLAKQERYQFTFRMINLDGSVAYKKITQYYIDRQREIIVMTREDVTPLIRAEMEKNELLASALEAANQASTAKSQFLSRMSHELRTPMNAIIGLSALAAGDVDNPVIMEDTIGKIGLSARYLLSLINDILEMSRIESGRMTLNEGPFDFEQLISSINNIIYGQAAEKGLDYDAVVNSFMEPTYVGDSTKLQQILINVLGNAVKFTPPGGKVTFAMEQLRRTNDRATIRFVISDTGVGMSDDFLPHIFDPFAQESLSFTSTSTGTGLGLAITKNMVEMMNGQIRVQSVKNVGSIFTIEVQLGISEESQKQLELLASMNLSKLRALIVDDDVIVCKSTEKILSAMGMKAEWVDCGLLAVERVREYHGKNLDFDTVFIDWKMPDMDGIEATRQIRQIVGPDVTIIIMTAYDWKTIEAEARQAGVDLFMEKPLFQSSIVNAFERIFTARKAKITVKPQKYDFTGMHILLAEDHPLNVEVAKRLLERVGAEIVVASNGLEALEAFTTAENNYFDVILMDVRMPIMDGLTSARSIRNLKKAGSKSIPIIAMTANAFDEDVKQSLSNGMDAHLTKPIEPNVLFSTLQRLVAKR